MSLVSRARPPRAALTLVTITLDPAAADPADLAAAADPAADPQNQASSHDAGRNDIRSADHEAETPPTQQGAAAEEEAKDRTR
jgi:hypothetical protein